jgi:hypothetical protein
MTAPRRAALVDPAAVRPMVAGGQRQGRHQGCGGGQGRGNGGGQGRGRGRGRDRRNDKDWRRVPPGPGQPEKKSVEGKGYHWCQHCKRWSTTHGTAGHTRPKPCETYFGFAPDPCAWIALSPPCPPRFSIRQLLLGIITVVLLVAAGILFKKGQLTDAAGAVTRRSVGIGRRLPTASSRRRPLVVRHTRTSSTRRGSRQRRRVNRPPRTRRRKSRHSSCVESGTGRSDRSSMRQSGRSVLRKRARSSRLTLVTVTTVKLPLISLATTRPLWTPAFADTAAGTPSTFARWARTSARPRPLATAWTSNSFMSSRAGSTTSRIRSSFNVPLSHRASPPPPA